MIYVNLKTATLRSPAYIGAEPVQRATWLSLLAHCCEQENGGRIEGAAAWKCRQWQQTCGVTLAEVQDACDLWTWDGAALVVQFYPSEHQSAMLAKRATVDDACHPSNYSRKLKDPRWQKRRLQVLEAAKWACATCGATDKTLHVHHKFYTPCTEPWDYPDEALCALCEDCHQHAEHEKETQQHGR